jgi:osmotically-inducible protein OsmY
MKRSFAIAFCSALLAFFVGCGQAEQDRARERAAEARKKAQQAAERLRAEAKRVGRSAEQEARALNHDLKQAVNSPPSSPGSAGEPPAEKLRHGGQELHVETGRAAQKLSHAALIAKVKAKLANDVGLSTVTSVDVDATGQVVTLRGTVSSEDQKRQAERAVRQLSGVTEVVDQLQIKP